MQDPNTLISNCVPFIQLPASGQEKLPFRILFFPQISWKFGRNAISSGFSIPQFTILGEIWNILLRTHISCYYLLCVLFFSVEWLFPQVFFSECPQVTEYNQCLSQSATVRHISHTESGLASVGQSGIIMQIDFNKHLGESRSGPSLLRCQLNDAAVHPIDVSIPIHIINASSLHGQSVRPK